MTRLTYHPALVAVIVVVASVVNCTPVEPDTRTAGSPESCTEKDFEKLEKIFDIGEYEYMKEIKQNGLTNNTIDEIKTKVNNTINEMHCSVNETEKLKQKTTKFVQVLYFMQRYLINSTTVNKTLDFLKFIELSINGCMNSTGTTTETDFLSIVFKLLLKAGRENCGYSKALEGCLLHKPEVKEKDTMNLIENSFAIMRNEMNCTEQPKIPGGASSTLPSYYLGVISALLAAGAYNSV